MIGVIDHHSLQVERPDEVAALIREALKYIPAERLIISSDCGMGREGMGRRHAAYKMVSMVLGTNIVRKELGLPEAECLRRRPALFADGDEALRHAERSYDGGRQEARGRDADRLPCAGVLASTSSPVAARRPRVRKEEQGVRARTRGP